MVRILGMAWRSAQQPKAALLAALTALALLPAAGGAAAPGLTQVTRTPDKAALRRPGGHAHDRQVAQRQASRAPRRPWRKPARPPPLLAAPDGPGSGDGLAHLPRRFERAAPAAAAQLQSVPRQLLLVLDQHQAGELANELARRHGLKRRQSQVMTLLSGRCELYDLKRN